METYTDYQKIEKSAKTRRILRNIFVYAMLVLWALMVLFPFYWMVLTSLKSYGTYNAEYIPKFFTLSPTLQNYADAFISVLCLPVFTGMIATMRVLPENMRRAAGGGFINATDCADYLTKKGMPFRDAYTTVGNLVYYCTQNGKLLEELSPEELKNISPLFGEDVYEALSLETCMGQRRSRGGPAVEETSRQIEELEQFISEYRGKTTKIIGGSRAEVCG